MVEFAKCNNLLRFYIHPPVSYNPTAAAAAIYNRSVIVPILTIQESFVMSTSNPVP
jgi:hypothetical protein